MKQIAAQGMLTKTYTSLTLSREQTTAWRLLSGLNARLREARRAPAANGRAALQEFDAAERYCHQRAIEQHLIPALRARVPQARALLAELEALAAASAGTLQQVRQQLRRQHARGAPLDPPVFSAMEQYCQHLLMRLCKEESELIPLAFRALTPEEWFAIAVQCLPRAPVTRGNTAVHSAPESFDSGQ